MLSRAFHRDDARASEAGLKYFVLGALSSGMLLYGASLLYGFAGTVSFAGIASAVTGIPSLGVVFGPCLPVGGIGVQDFRRALPYVDAGCLSGGADAGDGFFRHGAEDRGLRDHRPGLLSAPFRASRCNRSRSSSSSRSCRWRWGSFAAIGQPNFKRMMAYSSIGHVGFALVGLAAHNQAGVAAFLFYLGIYLVMVLGTFAAILSMQVGGKPVENISDLSGLARSDGAMAFFLSMLMFSLAGIPPLAASSRNFMSSTQRYGRIFTASP